MKTNWDYTNLAHSYDNRPDYSESAVLKALDATECAPKSVVADIGAGTGKLTKILLQKQLIVCAVEPNNNMRAYGIKNTLGSTVTWSEGSGEKTGLCAGTVRAAFFGSSFNVVDQVASLNETARILTAGGWFSCMWNHRDTKDSLQKTIEDIIHSFIPDYDYGLRRQDPSSVIEQSRHFKPTMSIEERFLVSMKKSQIVAAWKSHNTLFRQSNGKFNEIIEVISQELTQEEYLVPYFTRIWCARLINKKES